MPRQGCSRVILAMPSPEAVIKHCTELSVSSTSKPLHNFCFEHPQSPGHADPKGCRRCDTARGCKATLHACKWSRRLRRLATSLVQALNLDFRGIESCTSGWRAPPLKNVILAGMKSVVPFITNGVSTAYGPHLGTPVFIDPKLQGCGWANQSIAPAKLLSVRKIVTGC